MLLYKPLFANARRDKKYQRRQQTKSIKHILIQDRKISCSHFWVEKKGDDKRRFRLLIARALRVAYPLFLSAGKRPRYNEKSIFFSLNLIFLSDASGGVHVLSYTVKLRVKQRYGIDTWVYRTHPGCRASPKDNSSTGRGFEKEYSCETLRDPIW